MSDEMTVRELVHKMHAAVERMSKKNTHRALMLHGMSALMQLAKQVEELHERCEATEVEKKDQRVELVTLQ